uniref:probable disease resistance protein At5g66900 isoform X2 n=1 Tax=Erigeron canadensis TaxID=72917 RepID=UPI001CB8BAF6|nr:probable disease resistance protein At5g66900 isoform X2 [Erigeron canadensis]
MGSQLKKSYDVFLSFRGEDTSRRKTFTDHLYAALSNTGFKTFYDQDLAVGTAINEESADEKESSSTSVFEKAIKESLVAIIVFTKIYAAGSSWCLDELTEIMKSKHSNSNSNGAVVFPIYDYDVSPQQVIGRYRQTHQKTKDDFWLNQLSSASSSKYQLQPGSEAVFIQTIVKDVVALSNPTTTPLNVPSYSVGIQSRLRDVDIWLKDASTDARLGVISGMGGIGKTALAQVAYNINLSHFDATSFLPNIRLSSQLDSARTQLLADIHKGGMDQDPLRPKRVLVVLDDLLLPDQLDALVPRPDLFPRGSKIIVTTRSEGLLDHLSHTCFRIKPLDFHESLRLFSLHAFSQDLPFHDHLELSQRLVQHCEGRPLALEVLGSTLFGKPLPLWETALKELEAIADGRTRKAFQAPDRTSSHTTTQSETLTTEKSLLFKKEALGKRKRLDDYDDVSTPTAEKTPRVFKRLLRGLFSWLKPATSSAKVPSEQGSSLLISTIRKQLGCESRNAGSRVPSLLDDASTAAAATDDHDDATSMYSSGSSDASSAMFDAVAAAGCGNSTSVAMPSNASEIQDLLLSESIFILSDIVLYVVRTTANFKAELAQLQHTLERIIPIVEDAIKGNQKLNRTEQQSKMFLNDIQDAQKLVCKCLKIRGNFIKKFTVSLKLKDVNDKLRRFFQVEVQADWMQDIKQILAEVSDVKQRLDALSSDVRKEIERYELSERGKLGWRVPVLPKSIVVFDEPLKNLKVKILSDIEDIDAVSPRNGNDASIYRSIVVVVAGGGCGKTTLVTMLCHDSEIRAKFGANIFFVTVSKAPNLMVIVNDLFNPNSFGQPVSFQSNEDAKYKLRNFMRVKVSTPMLLVLDDVWSDSFLDNFTFSNKGCKILVTSRTAFLKYDVFHLDPLSDADAKTLFYRSVLTESKKTPKATIDGNLVNQMVECCKKHPLTLLVVGGFLKGRDELWWRYVLKTMSLDMRVLDLNNKVHIYLELSYQNMDDELKECYLDFGLFPEDQRISARALQDMWVHLYNHDEEGCDTLKKLVGLSFRNLTSIGPRSESGAVVNYCDQQFVTQHDLLRELAIRLSSKAEVPVAERKRLIIHAHGEDLPVSIRQAKKPMQALVLSIFTGEWFSSKWWNMKAPFAKVMILNFMSPTYSLPPFLKEMPKLEVLHFKNNGSQPTVIVNLNHLSHLSNLKRIRFEHVTIPSIGTSFLSLVNLQQLSFIECKIGSAFENVSSNNLKFLPRLDKIEIDYCQDLVEYPGLMCSSVHLQKLSITNCKELCWVHEDLIKLTSLETLSLRSCKKLKELPESLTRLEKLSIIDISYCLRLSELPKQMGKLGGLRTIYMEGCTRIIKLPTSIQEISHRLVVVCNEEISYLWKDFYNVEIYLVENGRIKLLQGRGPVQAFVQNMEKIDPMKKNSLELLKGRRKAVQILVQNSKKMDPLNADSFKIC